MSKELKNAVAMPENIKSDNIEVVNNDLNIENNRIKINGIAVADFGISATTSIETKQAIATDLQAMYSALKTATNSKFAVGQAIDNIRTHKTLEKLSYTENGKVKTVSEKASFSVLAKLYQTNPTTLKEAHLLYTMFKKPCVDGEPPIKEINGYPIDSYNDTQLLAIAYALNTENVKGVECFDDTAVNPMLSVKGVKEVCNKVTGKDKEKKSDEAKRPEKDTPLDKMPTKDFLGKIGDLLFKRLKTDEGKPGYNEMVKAHKALQDAFLKIAEAEKTENTEEAENK